MNGPQKERLCQIGNYKDGWQEEDKDDTQDENDYKEIKWNNFILQKVVKVNYNVTSKNVRTFYENT